MSTLLGPVFSYTDTGCLEQDRDSEGYLLSQTYIRRPRRRRVEPSLPQTTASLILGTLLPCSRREVSSSPSETK